MGEIYCLYEIGEGVPRYVGQTDGITARHHMQHITAALEKAEGTLYDWIREVWRSGREVEYFVLQTDIAVADLDLYKKYWISQFSDLLNVRGNDDAPLKNTETGERVIEEIRR